MLGRIGRGDRRANYLRRGIRVSVGFHRRLEGEAALDVGGRDRDRPPRGSEDAVEQRAALTQRTVDHQLFAGIEHIEDDVGHRHLALDGLADFLPSQPLLQFGERKRAVFGGVPGHDLAVEHQGLGEGAERRDQLGKGFRDFIQRAREQAHVRSLGRDVRLRADAVVFVLDRGVVEIGERFLGILHRAGQHEADRMEQPQARFAETPAGGQAQGLADVAQQHVRALHLGRRGAVGLGDGFLHQAFLQPDAQLAGDDLDDVLGFERRRLLE